MAFTEINVCMYAVLTYLPPELTSCIKGLLSEISPLPLSPLLTVERRSGKLWDCVAAAAEKQHDVMIYA